MQLAELVDCSRNVAVTRSRLKKRGFLAACLRAAETGLRTRIGGGVMRMLPGRDRRCPMAAALAKVQNLPESEQTDDPRELTKLVALLARQCELLDRARRDVRYKALLKLWLVFHVPLSFALLAALAAHIVAVFYYW